jgi:hypothetical protein
LNLWAVRLHPGLPLLRALALVLSLSTCTGSADPVGPATDGLVTHEVLPSETDASITTFNAEHLAWVDLDARSATPGLVVFLPGTGGAPRNTRLFPIEAARLGYHAIGLMYPDDLAVLQACSAAAEPECMEDMRAEIVSGVDRSLHVQVDRRNSIEGRLLALVRLLAQRHPAEGWESFIDADTLRWPRIVVSGLSQGGGHAAYIARERTVARVVMFGAPADGFGGQPAPWMSLGATPDDRYFGLAHERDPFTSIVPNWEALGLRRFGAPVLVDRSQPPFGGTHMLITELTPRGSPNAAHPSVVADGATPLDDDGDPLLAPTWRYMLGTPGVHPR